MISFKLRGKLPSKNDFQQGGSWHKRKTAHDRWKEKTFYAVQKQCDIDDPPDLPWVLKATGYVTDKRRRDVHNWNSHGLYGIQDALTEGSLEEGTAAHSLGLIEDDSWKYIRDSWVSYGRANDSNHVVVQIVHVKNLHKLNPYKGSD